MDVDSNSDRLLVTELTLVLQADYPNQENDDPQAKIGGRCASRLNALRFPVYPRVPIFLPDHVSLPVIRSCGRKV